MNDAEFKRVVEEGCALQRQFPELQLVAVGGTAAALHCHHRVSMDVDHVTPFLGSCYREVEAGLARWEGWQTHRRNPPVLILGERHGVALGLRQQRRAVALRTTIEAGLVIPTAREMLRVKAFLLVQRRAARDFVDVAALGERLGESDAIHALAFLNALYPSTEPQTIATRFAEACEAEPLDLGAVSLRQYKGLKAPFADWPFVAAACQRLGRALLKREMTEILPQQGDEALQQEDSS